MVKNKGELIRLQDKFSERGDSTYAYGLTCLLLNWISFMYTVVITYFDRSGMHNFLTRLKLLWKYMISLKKIISKWTRPVAILIYLTGFYVKKLDKWWKYSLGVLWNCFSRNNSNRVFFVIKSQLAPTIYSGFYSCVGWREFTQSTIHLLKNCSPQLVLYPPAPKYYLQNSWITEARR